ncbi:MULTISPECIES: hypothetical protein [Thioalkalivibrio]|uniref:hypothetical protein n=1 Tax=Thioalkalivibrio TaxID=106633 RepID=UPI00036AC973|nr:MULTISPECIES: hypothetical protein [Thioalkalivibrio]OOC48484.1 hypothetical protein B0684_09455 [Thioalkalivibrio versutus]
MRGRIDHGAGLVRWRIDRLLHRARALARRPAVLAIAFGCGLLAGRLDMPGIKYAYGILAGQMKAWRIASSLIGSPLR